MKIPPLKTAGSLAYSSWPFKDILIGISLLILLVFANKLNLFFYEPWLAVPVKIILWNLTFISLILYSLYICKKRGLWPLLHPISILKFLKELFISLGYALLINICVSIVIALSKFLLKIDVAENEIMRRLELAPSSLTFIITLIIMFTVGPIAEEFFFRGFLYNAIKSRFSIIFAAISQALIFSIYHQYDLLKSLGIFLYGLGFVIVYEKRKNLLTPILVHIVRNSFLTIPLLILAIQNYHIPAKNWNEAMIEPVWIKSQPIRKIERQENGMKQWQYAIDTWGSKGSKQWKMEANAFNAVFHYFPEDRTACAKAKLGIVAIYFHYLRDFRRTIIETNNLMKQYPEEREQIASALSKKGWAYYMLKDFESSRETFNIVVNDFGEYKDAYESARKGITWLDSLEY